MGHDPLMNSVGSGVLGTKPPSCGTKKPTATKKTPLRQANPKLGTPGTTTSYKYDFNPSTSDVVMLSEKQ